LVASFKATTTDNNIAYYSHLPSSTPGIYDVEIDTDTLQGRFRPQGGDWHPWVPLEGSSGDFYLTGQQGYPEQGIALHITYPSGSGTYSATLRFKNGVMLELTDGIGEFTNSSTGPFNVLINNYGDIIDSIDQKLQREESRLEKYENMLKEKYAKLESVLNDMNETLNYLSRFSTNQK
jgi:flagellar hook-associated protein 2